MSTLCPYNRGIDIPTYCHDGFPSVHESIEGEIRCEAYRTAALLSDVCCCDACVTIVNLNGVDYHIKPCEANDDCPYEGCMRHRVIQDIPVEMAAKAIEFHCRMKKALNSNEAEVVS